MKIAKDRLRLIVAALIATVTTLIVGWPLTTTYLGIGPGEVHPQFWLGLVGLALIICSFQSFVAFGVLLLMPD